MEPYGMIYLDNAATSYPKPRQVSDEVRRCLTQYGGNPGRGAHSLSLAAADLPSENQQGTAVEQLGG